MDFFDDISSIKDDVEDGTAKKIPSVITVT